ncbi:MAG: hypothetical protein ABL974_02080 [Prosthecobacter sp.]
MITTILSNTGPDRSGESCPRREKKRPTSQLRPSPQDQNAAASDSRPPPQDRISQKAEPPRSKSRNPARVEQAPSKNRGKAFPTG